MHAAASPPAHPLRVEGTLDPPLSRWLWLVKWLTAIPHAIVLVPLWIAFAGVSVAAFAAILVTGRYPRALFEFNAGVLRWTWRLGFYSYSALGTDRYPPFTLADVPGYPARLSIEYPASLSRGLVLLKWLLVLPQFLVVSLIGVIRPLLVLGAGAALLLTGRYPEALFDAAIGLDRWTYRVSAYAGLMTDEYPPFRVDAGGAERTTAPGPSPTAVRYG